MLPVLTQSCCGCSLATGSKIIGIFSLLASIVCIVIYSVELGNLKSYEVHNYQQIVALYGVWLAGACIQLIVSSLLLVSIFHRHPKTGIPWLVVFGFSLVAKLVALIACIVLGLVLYAVLLPIAIGLNLYFWLVVYSHWHEIKLEYDTLE